MKTKSVSFQLPVPTDCGTFAARYTECGLAEMSFPKGGPARRLAGTPPRGVPAGIQRWHRTTTVALKRILAGNAPGKLPPLDWTGKTEFQKSVWREMLKISPGKTKSYGEIAAAIGRPKAVRAVGGACGANPVPVLVPCHRILAANHQPGGFSGGMEWKRSLLAREGVKLVA